jgi:hypothetical protein
MDEVGCSRLMVDRALQDLILTRLISYTARYSGSKKIPKMVCTINRNPLENEVAVATGADKSEMASPYDLGRGVGLSGRLNIKTRAWKCDSGGKSNNQPEVGVVTQLALDFTGLN